MLLRTQSTQTATADSKPEFWALPWWHHTWTDALPWWHHTWTDALPWWHHTWTDALPWWHHTWTDAMIWYEQPEWSTQLLSNSNCNVYNQKRCLLLQLNCAKSKVNFFLHNAHNAFFGKMWWIIKYCESILFRGAEISSFEDDGHIRGYLTLWIALPTKLKRNTKLLPSIFDRCETEA